MGIVKYRIGLGNKVGDIQSAVIIEIPGLSFTADSSLIFADSTNRFADETQ